jgi:UDP-N-acetylglucosamine/UDP-N-acetyl-alpha-D-glucosaminouronate 4-epimerase
MMTYLVTGAAGFIGSSIARALIARGESVRGIDNFSTGKRENLAGLEKMDFMEADLNSPGAAEHACREVTCIFHEAALPSVPRSIQDPLGCNQANVDATVKLLDAARLARVKRIVYAGSSSAYGNTPSLPKREDMLPAPLSPYAVSKLAGEYYMSAFHRVYGLETVTLRYFNVFGPHQDPTSQYSGVLAIFISRMLRNEAIKIYGDGEQSRDFTYIDNVVNGNLLAAQADGGRVAGKVFNVATGSRITLNETVAILRELTGFSAEVLFGPDREGDVKHSLADIAAASAAFGYKPTVSFREGLNKTVSWYKSAAEAVSAGKR